MARRAAVLVGVLVGVLAVLAGLLTPAYAGAVRLPPTGTDWDYQLGGARPVPQHVGIVERDRLARPLAGKYDICYVNGFQTQVEQKAFWRRHWSLVLKDHGRPVTDSVWGEWLLDTRTPAKRRALAAIMGRWTDGCAKKGFQAVEYDNLDSFSRSHHLLTPRDNRRYAALLVSGAHAAGLAAAQKNWAEWDGTRVGFDFAVAEQCGQYRECAAYVAHYGDHVLAVEYHDRAFRWTCRHFGDRIAVVRRDVDLTRHGVRRWC
jgi:hypothetical protein